MAKTDVPRAGGSSARSRAKRLLVVVVVAVSTFVAVEGLVPSSAYADFISVEVVASEGPSTESDDILVDKGSAKLALDFSIYSNATSRKHGWTITVRAGGLVA